MVGGADELPLAGESKTASELIVRPVFDGRRGNADFGAVGCGHSDFPSQRANVEPPVEKLETGGIGRQTGDIEGGYVGLE